MPIKTIRAIKKTRMINTLNSRGEIVRSTEEFAPFEDYGMTEEQKREKFTG